jgi:thymidylate kinase
MKQSNDEHIKKLVK